MDKLFKIFNTANTGYIARWKYGTDGAVIPTWGGVENSYSISSPKGVQLFVEMLTFNNEDNCDVNDLEIHEFVVVKKTPCRVSGVVLDVNDNEV